VEEKDVMNTLALAGVGKLDTIAQVPLVKLRSPPALPFDWAHHGNKLSWGTTLVLLLCIVGVVTFVGWWMYRHGHWCQRNNPMPTVPVESVQTASTIEELIET
jgi:hypothetical protein